MLDEFASLQSWIDSAVYRAANKDANQSHEPQMVDSDYYKSAKGLESANGKPYWSTNLEMFARAFDAYVSDKLEERAQKNSYLSHAGRSGDTVPVGEERKAINAAFDKLIAEIQIKKTDQGTAMFSSIDPAARESTLPTGDDYGRDNAEETGMASGEAGGLPANGNLADQGRGKFLLSGADGRAWGLPDSESGAVRQAVRVRGEASRTLADDKTGTSGASVADAELDESAYESPLHEEKRLAAESIGIRLVWVKGRSVDHAGVYVGNGTALVASDMAAPPRNLTHNA